MKTLHCFAGVLGELIRTTATAGRLVAVQLTPMTLQNARGIEHFSISVQAPWLTAHPIEIVTPRGYTARYTVQKATQWMHDNMPGAACQLTVQIPDASGFARKWTPERISGRVQRMAALNPDQAMGAAVARAASMGGKSREERAEIMNATRAVSEAAAIIMAMRSAGAWPDPVEPITPDTLPPEPGQMWVPAPGAVGNRAVVPQHANGSAGNNPTGNLDDASHLIAARLKDGDGVAFWFCGTSTRMQKTTDQWAGYMVTSGVCIGLENGAYPHDPIWWDGEGFFDGNENASPWKNQIVTRYGAIRLSDGAVIMQGQMVAGDNYSETKRRKFDLTQWETWPVARYLVVSTENVPLCLAETPEAAAAAARAVFGWLMPNEGQIPMPQEGDAFNCVLCDLQERTETPCTIACSGYEVVGRWDDPVQVRGSRD